MPGTTGKGGKVDFWTWRAPWFYGYLWVGRRRAEKVTWDWFAQPIGGFGEGLLVSFTTLQNRQVTNLWVRCLKGCTLLQQYFFATRLKRSAPCCRRIPESIYSKTMCPLVKMPKAAMKSWLRLSPALVTEGAPTRCPTRFYDSMPCAMCNVYPWLKKLQRWTESGPPSWPKKKTRPVSHSFPKSQLRSSANNDGFNYGKNGDIIKNIYIYMYVCNEYMLGNDGDRIPTIPWFGHAGVGSCGNWLVLTNKIVRKLSLIFRWESRSCSYITAYIYAIAAPQEDGKERNHNFSATLCLYMFFCGGYCQIY